MSRVPLAIRLALDRSELGMFDGADIMVNPHLPAERVMFLECMATVEQAVEATGNAQAIKAFQWLGGFLSRELDLSDKVAELAPVLRLSAKALHSAEREIAALDLIAMELRTSRAWPGRKGGVARPSAPARPAFCTSPGASLPCPMTCIGRSWSTWRASPAPPNWIRRGSIPSWPVSNGWGSSRSCRAARTMAPGPTDTPFARIAAALGLSAAAEEAAILTAINARQDATPDPARFVPVEAVREMLAERALNRQTVAEAEAAARVDQAITAGYIPPALRDWGLALCRQDPASFAGFIAGAPPPNAHPTRAAGLPALNRSGGLDGTTDAEDAAVAAQLGIDPKAMR
jgi:hypothetical protein